ncbi:MAG: hypothetical protein ACKO3W_12035 [bacterium]
MTSLSSMLLASMLPTSMLPTSMLPGLTLAWTPFLQPAPGVDRWWWLLIVPLAFGMSISYKAIRVQDLRELPRASIVMALQIVGGLAALAVALFILVVLVLPHLPAE